MLGDMVRLARAAGANERAEEAVDKAKESATRAQAKVEGLQRLVLDHGRTNAVEARRLVLTIGRLGATALQDVKGLKTEKALSYPSAGELDAWLDDDKDVLDPEFLAAGWFVHKADLKEGDPYELFWSIGGSVMHFFAQEADMTDEIKRRAHTLNEDPFDVDDTWTRELSPDDFQPHYGYHYDLQTQLDQSLVAYGEYQTALDMMQFLERHHVLTDALIDQVEAELAA